MSSNAIPWIPMVMVAGVLVIGALGLFLLVHVIRNRRGGGFSRPRAMPMMMYRRPIISAPPRTMVMH
jgi:hypothetical protein